jgi:hypothetical protein
MGGKKRIILFAKDERKYVTHSQFLEGLKCESWTKNNEGVWSQGTLPSLQHYKRVEGHAGVPKWD